ncbi:hypothetical protein D9M72_571920 [compost metagenome]
MIGNPGAEPAVLLGHLEARVRAVELVPDIDRDGEGEERRQQRYVQDVAAAVGAVFSCQQEKQDADERHEGDRGKYGPIGHQKELPSIIHVTSAAMPISMANA